MKKKTILTEAKVAVYLRSVVKTPAVMAALQEQAKRSGADKLTMEEIQAEIDAWRDENALSDTKR